MINSNDSDAYNATKKKQYIYVSFLREIKQKFLKDSDSYISLIAQIDLNNYLFEKALKYIDDYLMFSSSSFIEKYIFPLPKSEEIIADMKNVSAVERERIKDDVRSIKAKYGVTNISPSQFNFIFDDQLIDNSLFLRSKKSQLLSKIINFTPISEVDLEKINSLDNIFININPNLYSKIKHGITRSFINLEHDTQFKLSINDINILNVDTANTIEDLNSLFLTSIIFHCVISHNLIAQSLIDNNEISLNLDLDYYTCLSFYNVIRRKNNLIPSLLFENIAELVPPQILQATFIKLFGLIENNDRALLLNYIIRTEKENKAIISETYLSQKDFPRKANPATILFSTIVKQAYYFEVTKNRLLPKLIV